MKHPLFTIEMFLSKAVIKRNGCWLWIGAKSQGRLRNGKGEYYGRFNIGGKSTSSHRVSYEIFNGDIPFGLEIDHLCRNPLCVRPSHLEAVSHSENCKRGTSYYHLQDKAKMITHCPNGHPYSKENTYITPGIPTRHCKQCVRDRAREYQRKKRAKQALEKAGE